MSIGIPAAGSTNHFAPGFVVSMKALVRQPCFVFVPHRLPFAVSRVSILGSTSLAVNRRRGAEGARSTGVAAIR